MGIQRPDCAEDGESGHPAAAMYAGLAVLSVIGIRAGLLPPPPSAGPGLALVTAESPHAVLVAIGVNPAFRDWVLKQLLPLVASLAVFASSGGHSADWEHRDPGGRIKTRGSETSGGSQGGGRLNFQEQLGTHTERKIIEKLKDLVKPGDIVTIRGARPPCNPGNNGTGCLPRMNQFARDKNIKIYYQWGDETVVLPSQ